MISVVVIKYPEKSKFNRERADLPYYCRLQSTMERKSRQELKQPVIYIVRNKEKEYIHA